MVVIAVTEEVLSVMPQLLQGAVGNGRADVDNVEAALVVLASVLVTMEVVSVVLMGVLGAVSVVLLVVLGVVAVLVVLASVVASEWIII